MIKIGVLASGRGSNFQSIIDAVERGYIDGEIRVLITDNPEAYAIQRAEKHGIEPVVMKPGDWENRDAYYQAVAAELGKREVDLVVLAGFMRIVGKPLIDAYPMRIMNIHPAILPSFPGLHGQAQAADYGVKVSGCTVHFVDEGMDTGPVIIQAVVPAYHDDTEESLAERILRQEHRIFPYAIKLFAEGRLSVEGRKVVVEGKRNPGEVLINPPIED